MFSLHSYHSQILKPTPDWVKIIQKVWVRFINTNNSATSCFVKLILHGSRVNALLNYINPERPTTSFSSVSRGISCAWQIATLLIEFLFGIGGIPKRQEGSRSQLNCLELWQLVFPFTLHRSFNQRLWICFIFIVGQPTELWTTNARDPADLFRF